MKLQPLSFLALGLLTACGPLLHREPVAVREISGVLTVDTRLEGEVLLIDDLLVPVGRTLTIAAGTTLRIRKSESTKIDPEYLSPATEILVRGALLAEGTSQAPIAFLPEQPVAAGDVAWAGILLDRAAPSSIRHCRIEAAEQGVLAIATSPELSNNLITGCRYGIVAQLGSAPKILDNRIESGEGGVFCWLGAKPYLKGNRITEQAEEGVFVDATSRPWLDRNTTTGNAIGLALYPRDLPFDPIGVSGNREDVRWLGGAP